MAAASLCWSGLGAAACAHNNAGAKLNLRPLLEPSCYDDLLSPLQHSLFALKNNKRLYSVLGGIQYTPSQKLKKTQKPKTCRISQSQRINDNRFPNCARARAHCPGTGALRSARQCTDFLQIGLGDFRYLPCLCSCTCYEPASPARQAC